MPRTLYIINEFKFSVTILLSQFSYVKPNSMTLGPSLTKEVQLNPTNKSKKETKTNAQNYSGENLGRKISVTQLYAEIKHYL